MVIDEGPRDAGGGGGSDAPRHFIGALGVEIGVGEDGLTHGRAELHPTMWVPHTQRVRAGVLTTIADLVGGMPPTGVLNPTVDMHLQFVASPPPTGTIHAVGHTLKLGRQIYVGEVRIDVDGLLVARAVVTFLNRSLPMSEGGRFAGRREPLGAESFDEFLAAERVDATTLAFPLTDGVRNGPGGTMQGGAQAIVGEIAAELALGAPGDHVVDDLDIRFLGRVVQGPLLARSEVLGGEDEHAHVRVLLTDGGDDERPVAAVYTSCRRIAPAG